jgi:hypothetical protein
MVQSGSAQAKEVTKKLVRVGTKQVFHQASPYIKACASFILAMNPYYLEALALWKVVDVFLEKYSLYELLPAGLGLFLALFGGRFALCISAFEAFRQVGYGPAKKSIDTVKRQLKKLKDRNHEDNVEDLDGDGIADVEQVSEEELQQRKIILVMTTVDPDDIMDAVAGINAGLLAVMAALNIKIAAAITMGVSIGGKVKVRVLHEVQVPLESILHEVDPGLVQWVVPTVDSATKILGIALSLAMERMVQVLNAALQGSTLFSSSILHFAVKHKIWGLEKILDKDNDGEPDLTPGTPLFQQIAYTLAGLGLLFQWRMGGIIPFPLNFLFLPLSMVEAALAISTGSKNATLGIINPSNYSHA